MPDLGWTEAQWEKVNSAVTEAFAKASVASAFLPCYGPLAGSAENVREELLTVAADGKVTVTNDTTKKLFNLTVKVELSSEQVADEALTSALLSVRRAANALALAEDFIVFNGYRPEVQTELRSNNQQRHQALPAVHRLQPVYAVIANNPDQSEGLAAETVGLGDITLRQSGNARHGLGARALEKALVREIAGAMASLENNSHPGPFACVLGHGLFVTAHNPSGSMVMAADRITPMLGGPLLRSSKLNSDQGIVVSLGGDAIDIVVATPPTVQFLQRTEDAKYLFRVYERFRLRIKDDPANPAVYAFELRA